MATHPETPPVRAPRLSPHAPPRPRTLLGLAVALVLGAWTATAHAGDNPGYRWDESQNPGGPNRCTNQWQCDGARTCSPYGWCQGVARPATTTPPPANIPGGASGPPPAYPREPPPPPPRRPPPPPNIPGPPVPQPPAPREAGYFIRSRLNGFVLDVKGASRAPLTPIIAYPQKQQGSENQQWELVPAGGPYYYIRSRLNGFVLDIQGASRAPQAPIIAYPQNRPSTDNQLWELVPSGVPSVYFIRSKLNGFVLDIKGASRAPQAPIIAYPQKQQGAENQLWELVPL
ncbi:MAG TPA: RICIN domain-containing protein [Polyangia bacterium]|nr:RICIN domain-containing protein [Polyangia bacterium]